MQPINSLTRQNGCAFKKVVIPLAVASITAIALGVLLALSSTLVLRLPGLNSAAVALTPFGVATLLLVGILLGMITCILSLLKAAPQKNVSLAEPAQESHPSSSDSQPVRKTQNLEKLFSIIKLLHNHKEPDLVREDLESAMAIAAQSFEQESLPVFFVKLIENGKEEDILCAKETLLEMCRGRKYTSAFPLCQKIVEQHSQKEKLVAIALEAAIEGCASEEGARHEVVFSLFWHLLYWSRAYSVEPFVQCLLIESKNEQPCEEFYKRLKEFITGNHHLQLALEEHLKHDQKSLVEVLANLSKSTFAAEASQLREKLQAKIASLILKPLQFRRQTYHV